MQEVLTALRERFPGSGWRLVRGAEMEIRGVWENPEGRRWGFWVQEDPGGLAVAAQDERRGTLSQRTVRDTEEALQWIQRIVSGDPPGLVADSAIQEARSVLRSLQDSERRGEVLPGSHLLWAVHRLQGLLGVR